MADGTDVTTTRTTCCVVGGGPAGMMLGYLLARAGVAVAADGRDSVIRSAAGLRRISHGVPIDVLWFRIGRRATPNPRSAV